MSKGLFFKIFLCGIIVFLLLPAVYEEDQAVSKKSPAVGNFDFSAEEDEDGLPVLEGGASSNIFSQYGRRFKKMYGKIFLGSPKNEPKEQFAAAPADGDEDDAALYQAIAKVFDDENRAGVRHSKKKDYSYLGEGDYIDFDSFFATPSSLKQSMHDNAPVKGLYEISSVESYENRAKAKQVYNNVMRKAERRAVSSKKAGIDSEITSDDGAYTNEFSENASYGAADGVYVKGDFLNAGNTFNRKYVGIASNNKNSAKGSRGKYGAMRNGKADLSEDLGKMTDLGEMFEASASKIQMQIKEGGKNGNNSLAGGVDLSGLAGGSLGGGNNGSAQGGSSADGDASGQGAQGGAGDGEGLGDMLGGASQEGGEEEAPSQEDDAAFAEDSYNESTEECSIVGDIFGDSPENTGNSSEDMRDNIKTNVLEKGRRLNGKKVPEEDRVSGCSGIVEPKKINGVTFLVDLGYSIKNNEKLRVFPNGDSVARYGLYSHGVKIDNDIAKLSNGNPVERQAINEDFDGITGDAFGGIVRNSGEDYVVIITTSKWIEDTYSNDNVGVVRLTNGNLLEYKPGTEQWTAVHNAINEVLGKKEKKLPPLDEIKQ